MTFPQYTEAHDVAQLARQAALPSELEPGKLYLIADADGGVQRIDTDSYADRPRNKTGKTVVTDAESFSAYVDKHGVPDETEITANTTAGTFTAAIDAGTQEEPGWGTHTAVLSLKASKEWARWAGKSGQMFTQADFAEFIEDNAENIVEPTSAAILEIAQSLQVSRGVEFESGHRLSDGNVQFGYRETTTATAGNVGQLSIPASFTLALRPFEGGEAYRVTAHFRYRLHGKQLNLGYKLQGADRIREDAFKAVAGGVRDYAEKSGFLYLTSD